MRNKTENQIYQLPATWFYSDKKYPIPVHQIFAFMTAISINPRISVNRIAHFLGIRKKHGYAIRSFLNLTRLIFSDPNKVNATKINIPVITASNRLIKPGLIQKRKYNPHDPADVIARTKALSHFDPETGQINRIKIQAKKTYHPPEIKDYGPSPLSAALLNAAKIIEIENRG